MTSPRTKHISVLGVLLAGACLAAQAVPPPLRAASPASVGVNAAKLKQAVDLYRQAVQRDDVRGAVLFVARQGKVVLHEAVGWKHQAYRLPMEKDTLFRMASNTKPLTATCVLMLQEEGKLAVSDPVARYLKSFDNVKSRDMTIERLLTHTSGFRIEPILFPFAAGEEPSLQGAVARFGAEGPAAAPGEYSYSNAGFNTLGAIIEVASGMGLEPFMKSRIYDPLGMTDSLNHEDPAKLARMATVYRGRRGADGRVTFTQGFTPGDAPDFPVIRASGGLISTAADYARFLQMYLDQGTFAGRRLLSKDSIAAATRPHVKVDATTGYGFGWMTRADGSYSHSGSDGTMAWVDPARQLIGMVLTQSPGGNNPTAQFRTLIEEAVGGSR